MSDAPKPRFLDPRSPPHIATLTALAGISALSMNLYLPSLPDMAEDFGTPYAVMQLSVPLYLAVSAVLQIVIGPISDRYGRRPVLLGSFSFFLAATLGCALAPNVETFLVYRMLQAAVVAGMVLSRAVVRDMVPADEAASMIAYVTMGMSLVPMIAPAIGGYVGAQFGWRASFWLLILLGAGTTWLLWRDLGETATRRPGGFAAQIRAYPELLTSPRFWGYTAASLFTSGAFFAYLGGAPFVGSEIYHLDPARLGLLFGLPALGYLVGNGISGRYAARFGINRMILLGTILSTGALALLLVLNLTDHRQPLVFFGFMVPLGIGNGLVMPNAIAGALSVRPQLAGSASGLSGALMIGGGAALSAFSGALLSVETGAAPLIELMLTSSALSLCAIIYVRRRSARLASGV